MSSYVNVYDTGFVSPPSTTSHKSKPPSIIKLHSSSHVVKDEKKDPGSGVSIGSMLKTLVIFLVVIGCLAVIGAAAYVGMTALLFTDLQKIEDASCRAVEKALKEGLPQSSIFANRCRKKSCTFDIQTCSVTCPFGYTTDINTGCETDCACASTGGIFDGDIQFDVDDLPGLFAEFVEGDGTGSASLYANGSRTSELWPVNSNNRVELPFEIDSTLGSRGRTAVFEAADWLKNNTCVDLFPKRDTDTVSLKILSRGPCRSKIGFQRKTAFVDEIYQQDLVVNKGCDDVSAVLHLLFHALGFYHEQSRPDRDAFISLDESVVNFALKSRYDASAQNVTRVDLLFPYNVKSIMHHTSDMEVKEGDYLFIRRSTGTPQLIRPVYPDANDVAELHQLYGCNSPISKQLFDVYAASAADEEPGYQWGQVETWSEWTSWSECYEWCGNSTQTRYQSKRPLEAGGTAKWERRKEDHRDCFPKIPCDRSNWKAFVEKRECNTVPCTAGTGPRAIIVSWQEWGGWGSCSRTMCLLRESASRERYCFDQLFRKSDDCPNKELPEGFRAEDAPARSIQTRECECTAEETRRRVTIGPTSTLGTLPARDPSYNMFAPASELRHNYFSLCSFNERNDQVPKWLNGEYDDRPGADWVCHDTTLGYYKLGYSDDEGRVLESSYADQFQLCKRLFTGDFNNDGKDDLLCVDPENSEMAVHLNQNNLFLGDPVVFDVFCVDTADQVVVSDVDGDGKDDVVCLEPSGHISVRLNIKNDW